MREEKMEQQRLHQEERVRKALERAKADPKKQVCACVKKKFKKREGCRILMNPGAWAKTGIT